MRGVFSRRFGFPALLSMGLHGLAVVTIGTFQHGPVSVPALRPELAVDLVQWAEPRAAAVSPASVPPRRSAASKEPSRQKVRPKARPVVAVKRALRVPKAQQVQMTSAQVRPLALTTPMAPSPVVIAQAVATVSDPIPPFLEVPRPVTLATFPPAVSAGRSVIQEPDLLGDTFSLSAAGALSPLLSSVGAPVPVGRPFPAVGGTARMLRDTVAESGPPRTKVRMGNNPRPEYPRTAREAGWEGTVVLWVEVLPDGAAGAVTLNKSSGHTVLDESALSAVQSWRFVPAMDGNFPVRSVVQLPVRFDLKAAN